MRDSLAASRFGGVVLVGALLAVLALALGVPLPGLPGGSSPDSTSAQDGPTTYTVSYEGPGPRDRAAIVAKGLAFWEGDSLETDVDFEPAAPDERPDYQFRFTGRIPECNGTRASGTFFYCGRDTANGTTTIEVANLYTDNATEQILRSLGGQLAGYDDPASVEGVLAIGETPLSYIDPWPLQSRVVVNLSVTAETDRDWVPLVQAGIDYWQANDDRYGTYTETFVFRPDAARADVTLSVVDEIEQCGVHTGPRGGTSLGCSDLLDQTTLAAPNTSVRIVAGYTDQSTLHTIKHEFGHLYGKRHGEEPMPIMSATNPYGDRRPQPDATARDYPFRTKTVQVYVDYDSFDASRDSVRRQVGYATEYYSAGADGYVPADLTVERTDNRSAAEIRVISSADPPCSDDSKPGSCTRRFGESTDTDDALEYYTGQEIYLDSLDTDVVGWHTGYSMGFTLAGAETLDELPPPFRDADYDDRRNWWR